MSDKLYADIVLYLAAHRSLTLAYTDASGVGACGLWYAHDEHLNLYFLTSPTTRHGKALRNSGEVAFTIHKDDQEWTAITGLQGSGRCDMLTEAQSQMAWRVYSTRFPFVREQFADIDAALRVAKLWQIAPTWLRLIDNAKAFGYKRELTL
jgi:uncharacterized protein YhbP (UPF0306 family)